jgi:hypothetical protein
MRAEEAPLAPDYSFWLLPSLGQAPSLAAEIAAIAPYFGTSAFPPHMTIQGDLSLSLETLASFLPQIAGGLGPLFLRVEAVRTSSERFRSLYLGFEESDSFLMLQERSRKLCGTAAGLSPFPHLSIAYGEPGPGRDKSEEAARLSSSYLGTRILFSRLVLAASSSSLPIGSWRVVSELELGAGH